MRDAALADLCKRVELVVTRGEREWSISPAQFEEFAFEGGEGIQVLPAHVAERLKGVWAHDLGHDIEVAPGHSIRVPKVYDFAEFKGFRIPTHLIKLTGGGPETLEPVGRALIENYQKYTPFSPDMTIIDLGCGIGRLAFQLLDWFKEGGAYIGIDVTSDSIEWCKKNITVRDQHLRFCHFDAYNDVYNPFGTTETMAFRLPAQDQSVDRIFLSSVFTHLLEAEITHYLREFRRVLKPSGLVHASFFLYTPEALEGSRTNQQLGWSATFDHPFADGAYVTHPDNPRSAIAYTDEAMQRMISRAQLRMTRPYLKGWWSGIHGDQAEFGQDAAILAR